MREIGQDYKTDLHFSDGAFDALQSEAELYITQCFKEGGIAHLPLWEKSRDCLTDDSTPGYYDSDSDDETESYSDQGDGCEDYFPAGVNEKKKQELPVDESGNQTEC